MYLRVKVLVYVFCRVWMERLIWPRIIYGKDCYISGRSDAASPRGVLTKEGLGHDLRQLWWKYSTATSPV